jgi:hypothetical protein
METYEGVRQGFKEGSGKSKWTLWDPTKYTCTESIGGPSRWEPIVALQEEKY